eukprot:Gregarina_sp_Poly_1__1092@NODE_1267_length_4555_cov_121_407977_g862_i0_p1_GENE_NODE_1267_length_4555_cov_121_407977_g862_i0NODE_1267_length_4555_cov_121_407977_g862_i0_p1_ORF_typecomplete_len330_score43_56_NODE_1267_length_4555_cov_121_407977_g862_i018632852
MHTKEKVLRKTSLEMSTEEASDLITFFESLRSEEAVPQNRLPEVYNEWLVVVPKPVSSKEPHASVLREYKGIIMRYLASTGSKNFIFNDVKEEIIQRIGAYIHNRFQALQPDYKGSTDLIEPTVPAAAVVGTHLLEALGLESDCSFSGLHDFMDYNMGIRFQADYGSWTVCRDQPTISSTVNSTWRSHLEQMSRFTWFTSETIITVPEQDTLSYKILRPQLFRCPQFSNTLVAKATVATVWNAASCSQRKAINEKMIRILTHSSSAIENSDDVAQITNIVRVGARDWAEVLRECSLLEQITDVEWELLFCDFLIDGIYEAAITHLEELA